MEKRKLFYAYLLLTGLTLALPWWVGVSQEGIRVDTLWLFGVSIKYGTRPPMYEILSVRIDQVPSDASPLIRATLEAMFLPHAQLLPFLYLGSFVFLSSCALMNIGDTKSRIILPSVGFLV